MVIPRLGYINAMCIVLDDFSPTKSLLYKRRLLYHEKLCENAHVCGLKTDQHPHKCTCLNHQTETT